jgi:hypothetical protein
MAIKSSGTLSLRFDIAAEFGTSRAELRYLSSLAGFSTPDAMSEFYGFSVAPPPPPPPPPPPSCGYVGWDGFGVMSYQGGGLGARANYSDDCTNVYLTDGLPGGYLSSSDFYFPGVWDGQINYGSMNHYWYFFTINENIPSRTFSVYLSPGSYRFCPHSFSLSLLTVRSQDIGCNQIFFSAETTSNYFGYGIGPVSYL